MASAGVIVLHLSYMHMRQEVSSIPVQILSRAPEQGYAARTEAVGCVQQHKMSMDISLGTSCNAQMSVLCCKLLVQTGISW